MSHTVRDKKMLLTRLKKIQGQSTALEKSAQQRTRMRRGVTAAGGDPWSGQRHDDAGD